MALRRPRSLFPFVRHKPRPLSAHEALALADPVFRKWPEADFARLCCVYAGALEGENPDIGPLDREGRGRLWHFDFFARPAERFLRVQVCDGHAQSEETRIRAGGLGYPQMAFPFAAYGYREDRGREAAPVELARTFADSTVMMASLCRAWGTDRMAAADAGGAFVALLIPAPYLRIPGDGEAPRATENPASYGSAHEAALIVAPPSAPQRPIALRFDRLTGERIVAI